MKNENREEEIMKMIEDGEERRGLGCINRK